jgi:Taurine catabolism dioxygenase TauD, TfdA family
MTVIQPPALGRPYVEIDTHGKSALLGIDPADVIRLIMAHGAILIRGTDADVDQFRNFAKQFCPTSVFNESPGRSPIDDANNIHSVDGGTNAFSLHPELAREPWKPDAAFFACFSPPSVGGETTVCDGIEIVRHLPDDVRRGLEGRRLFYVKQVWPELLDFWLGTPDPSDKQLACPPPSCPYEFRRLDGQIARIFSRPALHRPMFSGDLAFGNFLLFARFNNGRRNFPVLDNGQPVPESWLQAIKTTSDRLTCAISWQSGDVLMLDNTRFMHGRKAILDSNERQIATYFGYFNFAPTNPDEPPDPIWRRENFRPPVPPSFSRNPLSSVE